MGAGDGVSAIACGQRRELRRSHLDTSCVEAEMRHEHKESETDLKFICKYIKVNWEAKTLASSVMEGIKEIHGIT